MTNKAKDKQQKMDTRKSAMKYVKNVKQKSPQRTPESKERKVEEKTTKKKSQNRKLIILSDSEIDVEAYFLDVMPFSKRKIRGKRVPVNIHATPQTMCHFTQKAVCKSGRLWSI